jgi:hypothetical protein
MDCNRHSTFDRLTIVVAALLTACGAYVVNDFSLPTTFRVDDVAID